jgi:F-type H+-transporting ATPase subunit epsilon
VASATDSLRLEVATPLGLALGTAAESVSAPSVRGEFGVLPGHLPLLAALKSGVLRYRVGGKDHVVAVGPGFVEAGSEKVLVLTDKFVTPTEVDAVVTKAELAAAEKKLSAFPDAYVGPDYEVLQLAVDWAQAKLDALAESQR